MRVAVFFDVLFKLRFYDFKQLQKLNLIKIAFVAAEEYSAFAHDYAQYFEQIIVIKSTDQQLDYAQSAQELGQLVQRYGVAALRLICSTELQILLVAQLRELYGIKGMWFKQAQLFRDKIMMKNALVNSAAIKVPAYLEFKHDNLTQLEDYFKAIVAQLGPQFILKPRLLAGAVGVFKITNYTEFMHAVAQIKSADYELESFVVGELYHVDSIYQDGKPIFQCCSQYSFPNLEFQHNKPILSLPLPAASEIAQRASAYASALHLALDYANGASHLEFFVSAGELIFLEIAARTPGLLVVPMLEHMFAVNLLNLSLEVELSLPVARQELNPQQYYFSGAIPVASGLVQQLHQPQLKGSGGLSWQIKPGDKLTACTGLLDIAATIMVSNSSFADAYHDFQTISHSSLISYAL